MQVAIGFELPIAQPDPHVSLVGRIADRTGGDALIAAGLRYAGDQIGLQHPGSLLGRQNADLPCDLPQGVQPAGEQVVSGRRKRVERIGKPVVVVTFERVRIREERHFDACLQTGCDGTGQPTGVETDLCIRCAAQYLRRRYMDLQPVGLYGLYADGVVERLPAHLEPGIPLSGRCILGRLCPEDIDAVDTAGERLPVVELFTWGMELHRHGMVGRKGMLLVLDDQCEVYLVPRPPDSAFAIDKAFDPLRGLFAADIKPACRELRRAVDLQKRGGCTVGCRNDEGIPVRTEVGKTLLVGAGRADLPQLEIIGRYANPGKRRGGHDVRDRTPQAVGVRPFDNQPQIGGGQIVFWHVRRRHVVALFRRVIALPPFVLTPVIIRGPASDIGAGFVPGLLVR